MSCARGIVFEAASGTPPNVPKAPLKTQSCGKRPLVGTGRCIQVGP
jgi:hypothetical protein